MRYSKSSSKREVYSNRDLPQETSVSACSLTQLCLIICKSMDCSSLSSSVHGILQARILEWVAISYSKGSSQPRDRTCVSDVSCIGSWVLYHWQHLGSPNRAVGQWSAPLPQASGLWKEDSLDQWFPVEM